MYVIEHLCFWVIKKEKIPSELVSSKYLAVNEYNFKIKLLIVHLMVRCKYLEIIRKFFYLALSLTNEYQKEQVSLGFGDNNKKHNLSEDLNVDDYAIDDQYEESITDVENYFNDVEICFIQNENLQNINASICDIKNLLIEKIIAFKNVLANMINVVRSLNILAEDDLFLQNMSKRFLKELVKQYTMEPVDADHISISELTKWIKTFNRNTYNEGMGNVCTFVKCKNNRLKSEYNKKKRLNPNIMSYASFIGSKIDELFEITLLYFITPFHIN
ncbi:uncharacterized protein LOC126896831 [Daktulosphaira vitifoliae]|uniref:uncharacterized protein LOC126896831 n=1 Tax=Daktulosphaira vitifoliae TaxID=58002 RepID=UPI0021AA0FF4|nr:uncharacterized protein LOC126896831 [Daktulosphaira vitifoliae]